METMAGGVITPIVTVFTFAALIFGALFGMMRGRNRAILRLGLVMLSIILAVTLRTTIVGAIMNLNLGDGTVREMLVESFDSETPEFIINLVISVFEILIGVIAFYVFFFALRLVTHLILFPILKIFVKKGEKKGILIGALVGLFQGIVVAFIVCAPLSGMLVQVEKISEIEMDGEQLFEIPEDVGVHSYNTSAIGRVYYSTGNWFFNLISTGKDADGNRVTVSDMCDIVATIVQFNDTLNDLSDSADLMRNPEATPAEKATAMKNVGQRLKELDENVDNLSEDAKEVIDSVVSGIKDMIVAEGGVISPELEENLDSINLDNVNLSSAGDAMTEIGNYIERSNADVTTPATQEEVNVIINGIADNPAILNALAVEAETAHILDVQSEDVDKFENAIAASSASEEDKEALRKLFGINQ